jgi:hypothetical protein
MSEVIKKLQCGLVMPISSIDGCSAEHWVEVKTIITESMECVEKYDISVKLVSDADEIGVIQKRIVQNLYNTDVVVCDVSSKNPNVMFELGMRLAFDKPTVIIKDDKTNYSFDTGIIEHLEYPRDLRFNKIVEFKEKLSKKIIASYEGYINDPEHSTFLKNFGKFKVASIDESKVSPDNLIIEMLSDIQNEMGSLKRRVNGMKRGLNTDFSPKLYAEIKDIIRSYYDGNNCINIEELHGNEDFYKYVEDKIDAPRHFESKSEFVNFITQHLNSSSL